MRQRSFVLVAVNSEKRVKRRVEIFAIAQRAVALGVQLHAVHLQKKESGKRSISQLPVLLKDQLKIFLMI